MTSAATSAPFVSLAYWRAYWITLRSYLFSVSGASGLLGLALWPQESLFAVDWWVTFGIAFVAYGLGQSITDCTQLDTDSISSPYRPMVRGIIRPHQVVLADVLFLVPSAVYLASRNPSSLAVVALMLGGISTYTYFKRRYWGGPPWNSWIVALLPLLTWTVGSPARRPWHAPPELLWLMGSVFFSYAIFVILGYFKDISADTATGYQTVVVRFGWRKAVSISFAHAVGALACSAWLAYPLWRASPRSGLLALALWAGGAVLLLLAHAQLRLMREDEDQAYGPIAHSVRGYVLLHCGEAVFVVPALGVFCVAFLVVSHVLLATRIEKRQV